MGFVPTAIRGRGPLPQGAWIQLKRGQTPFPKGPSSQGLPTDLPPGTVGAGLPAMRCASSARARLCARRLRGRGPLPQGAWIPYRGLGYHRESRIPQSAKGDRPLFSGSTHPLALPPPQPITLPPLVHPLNDTTQHPHVGPPKAYRPGGSVPKHPPCSAKTSNTASGACSRTTRSSPSATWPQHSEVDADGPVPYNSTTYAIHLKEVKVWNRKPPR
ncbi:hypothetical protein SAMN05444515_108111 [Ectothiorhodospira marina]|uniref:Uncharacterized protein n=1 Tax=Ectothiorhodospira marina TaxID=1396821 RepID=A0A1H7M3X0_9GAMM|nr:hypothetical protein SAMN05444515_108111 [Ectothiorhodospira marina]